MNSTADFVVFPISEGPTTLSGLTLQNVDSPAVDLGGCVVHRLCGDLTLRDVFYLINFLFAGGPVPAGIANVNGDSANTVADVFYLINYLFAGGPAPL